MAEHNKRMQAIYGKNPWDWSDDELQQVLALTDDDLVRFSGSANLVPAIEATRRLREAIRAEERAIKHLTRWLVAFTLALVVLTILLVSLGIVEHRQHRSEVEAMQQRALAISDGPG